MFGGVMPGLLYRVPWEAARGQDGSPERNKRPIQTAGPCAGRPSQLHSSIHRTCVGVETEAAVDFGRTSGVWAPSQDGPSNE